MGTRGARSLTVTAAQATANSRLLGGPLVLCGWSLNDGTATQEGFVDQSAAAPGAGATIASLSLPNGVWQIEWTFELGGAAAAADADNVSLNIGATQIDQSANAGAAGTYGPFHTQATVTGGPLTLAAKAIGAATAATTYRVRITATPLGTSQATIFDGSQPVAFSAIPQALVDTQTLNDNGVAIGTHISVQATQGQVSGVLWFYLLSDLEDPDDSQTY